MFIKPITPENPMKKVFDGSYEEIKTYINQI